MKTGVKTLAIISGFIILLLVSTTACMPKMPKIPEIPEISPPDIDIPIPGTFDYEDVQPYEYQELDYITESFPPTDKSLEFVVGTADLWGNFHLWVDLGENTKKSVTPTMARISDIGGEALLLTDIVILLPDGGLHLGTNDEVPAWDNITQEELKDIVSQAKANGIEKVMMLTNIGDTEDDVVLYLESAERAGNESEAEMVKRFAHHIENNVGLSSREMFEDFSEEEWDAMFERWKEFMIYQAQKCEGAGVEYLIVNVADCGFDFYMPVDYLSEKYKAITTELREHFSGKIGLYGFSFEFLTGIETDYLDFVVIWADANASPEIKEIFSDIEEDVDSIEAAWTEFLTMEEWQGLSPEKYLLVLLPSYDGALKTGWIEPGRIYTEYHSDFKEQALGYEGLFRALYNQDVPISSVITYGYWWNDRVYPETQNMRTDLSHSIRIKDAEHVFYKWASIFK